MNYLWRAFKLVLPHKGMFFLFLGATAGWALFGGIPLVLVKNLLDLITSKPPQDEIAVFVHSTLESLFGGGKNYLYGLALIFFASFALRAVFGFFTNYLSSWLAQRLRMEAMTKIMNQFLILDLSFFDKSKTGDLVSRMVSDGNALRVSVKVFLDFARQPLLLICLAGYAFYLDSKLFLVGAIGVPIVIGPLIALTKRIYKQGRKYQERTAELTENMLQNINGMRIVHAYGAEQAEQKHFEHSAFRLFKTGMRRNLARALQRPLSEIIFGMGISAVVLYGGSRVLDGTLQPSEFMVFVGAGVALYDPIKAMLSAIGQLAEMVPAAERTFEILDIKPKISDKPNAADCPTPVNSIVYDNVSFDYGRGLVFSNLNLEIKSGERFGIVGKTGIGKSTLISLLMRFYDPTSGRITINGQDIKNLKIKSLRDNMALVSQDPFLFNVTIAENIRYGNPNASPEDIENAAKAAAIHDEILALPSGYQTQVGERGVTLSGGQRQRIAVARAVIRNAPVLLLDEPTSALDSASEKLVQDALDNLAQGRTSLIVAHRLSTLKQADRIIVFGPEGGIEAVGPHTELMGKSPTYAELWEKQTSQPQAAPEAKSS